MSSTAVSDTSCNQYVLVVKIPHANFFPSKIYFCNAQILPNLLINLTEAGGSMHGACMVAFDRESLQKHADRVGCRVMPMTASLIGSPANQEELPGS